MDKKVLVTGSTRGIGRAICDKFIRNNCKVIGIARNKVNTNWPFFECDVADVERLEATFQEICQNYGIPDVLINNAGIYYGATWNVESLKQYDDTMIVNARAIFHLSQLYARKLISVNKTGTIINISSVSGRIGSIDPAYAASKAAVDALTKSFARGLASSGIRVNAVSPGPVNTDMAKTIPKERKKQYRKLILQQRFAEPREIANLVFFLASNKASILTGEILYATGGIL